MIGWLLAGLAGAAVLNSDSSYGSEGLISGRDKTCSLCGRGNNDWKVVGEWKEYGTSHIKVRFSCSKCGRSWAKTYEIN